MFDTLSQMDPDWKDKLLGFDTKSTIGEYGCLLTSISMVVNYFGYEETPDTLNEKMKAVGGFQGAFIIPAKIPAALPGMLYRNYVQCYEHPAPLTEIDAALSAERPVIVEIDRSPSSGVQSHWVVIYNKEKEEDDYLILDPWPYPASSQPTALLKEYGDGQDISQVIKAALWLDREGAPTIPASEPDLDKGVEASFPVYATVDGLALRSQPLVADHTLIKRMSTGTQLAVLEADGDAEEKIGVLDQWLPVRDPEGVDGYTAAWYVTKAPPGQSEEFDAESGERMMVKTSVDYLALRSQPEISEETLIKYLPFDADLLVLEPVEIAQRKVGSSGQWLQVRDVTEAEGYVAAWYLVPASGQAALGASAQPEDAPQDAVEEEYLVVRVAADSLALRTQPLITAETLIDYLPLNTELLVLDEREAAEERIGMTGEWLNVRDARSREGYVAAWYVR
jgi:hypothetical protein